jgi:DNA-binding GntR family transcriptional regulator
MLIEKAYQKVKGMIFDQKLAPGQKLTYGELSKTLNMSPTPIINALHRLEHEGMVESVPFKGFYVKSIGLQEAWDLFGVREALETFVVEQVISLADPKDLALLEKKMIEHASYKPENYDRKRFMLDAEFHLQLASMSKNQALVRRLSTIFEHFYMRFKFDTVPLERLQSSADEHRNIVERIRRKDTYGSRDAMRIHVQNARNHIIQIVTDEQILNQASSQ